MPLSDWLAFLKWVLALAALQALGLPLAFRLFARLPERGYALAKLVGWLALGYLTWLLGSLGLAGNDLGAILLGALLVAGAGALWLGPQGWADLRTWLRRERSYILAVEGLFLAAFLAWTLVRAYNPAILGTEKPMEYMFLNAILRSPALPPQDAWLSDHAISYYYFGYYLVALLTRLTAVPAAVAFNLALAALFALSAQAALGVVLNLILMVKAAHRPTPPPLLSGFAPALLAPLLLLVVGNFYGILDLARQNRILAEAEIPVLYYDFGDLAQGGSQRPGVRFGPLNLWAWLDLKPDPLPPSTTSGWHWDLGNWFFAARTLHDRDLLGRETEAIDEFPAFSFLLGDLHPHLLALPFDVLGVGLALAWLLRGLGGRPMTWRREWPFAVLSALILGGLAFLNTWDFPIYLFLIALADLGGLGLRDGWEAVRSSFWRRVGIWALLGLASLALYWPYFLVTFQSQAGGILPNLIYPTRFQQAVVMFGPLLLPLFITLLWLRGRGRAGFDPRAAWTLGMGSVIGLAALAVGLAMLLSLNADLRGLIFQALSPLRWNEALGFLLQRRVVDGLTVLVAALGLAWSGGLAVGWLRRGERAPWPSPSERPALWLMLALFFSGALLWLAPEFIYLRDNFGTRMNTLFKFYFQTWVLWSLGGAFGVWFLAQHAGRLARVLGVGLSAVGFLLGGYYLIGSLPAKTGNFAGPPTLDGMAYFAATYPNDWAAIRWLQDNAPATAVLLEGSRGAYWIEGRSSRFAMATGIPTLMGWANHEAQWRGNYFGQVARRLQDIQTLYQTRDDLEARLLLERYHVDFVIVSDLERQWYRPLDEGKFERLMRRVFQQGDVVIYQR